MKKILNKKGFTLIELLAVIVVLGIVMVFAVGEVIENTNKAKGRAAITHGDDLKKDIDTACIFEGYLSKTEVEEIIKGDKIFGKKLDSVKYYEGSITLSLSGTDYSTVIAPEQNAEYNVRLLKSTGKDEDGDGNTDYILPNKNEKVSSGRLYIHLDNGCTITGLDS